MHQMAINPATVKPAWVMKLSGRTGRPPDGKRVIRVSVSAHKAISASQTTAELMYFSRTVSGWDVNQVGSQRRT